MARAWRLIAPALLYALLFSNLGLLSAESEVREHLDHHAHLGTVISGWDGSAQGVAYSEFNHHLAGLFVLLMGCAELGQLSRLPSLLWLRFFLPTAMLSGSFILLVWSDHEAWPIGSLGLVRTFSGDDSEILQHKIYAILLFLVGVVEALRRTGRIANGPWSAPLPLFAIVGGLMLFGHSHGLHPSAQKIAMDHAMMGALAVTAGWSKLMVERLRSLPNERFSRWEFLWGGLIVLIGMQLLMYSE